jgi:hypothetical protein
MQEATAAMEAQRTTTAEPNAPTWFSAFKVTLFAFVLSRYLIVLASALTFALTQHWPQPEASPQFLSIFTDDYLAKVHELVLQDDATWYLQVAQHGYDKGAFDATQFKNWAFFPLHPMVWRAAIKLGLTPWIAGVLLANLFSFIALMQTYRWIGILTDRETAKRGVLCIALFPTSYFLSVPFSEPLYFLLVSSTLLSLQEKRWNLAALAAGLCSGTRATGIFLAPLLWWQSRQDLSLTRRTLLALFGGFGLAAFMYVLWRRSGDPLAFAHIQVAWGRDGSKMFTHLWEWLCDPFQIAMSWNVMWFNNGALVLALAACIWLWIRGYRALALFAFGCILMPWSGGNLMGMARYVSVCVPVFFALACWLRNVNFLLTWLIVSACALVWMTGCFTIGATFAGV